MKTTFKIALENLGFKSIDEQEACLQILQIAGYFQPKQLWENLQHLNLKNPKAIFKQLQKAIKLSKADQDDPRNFDVSKMLELLSEDFDNMTEQEAMDLLFYIAQNAFARNSGVERNELISNKWMKDYEQEYLAMASKIGLVDRKLPIHKEYDLAWIAGASRVGVLARIIDYNNIIKQHNIMIKGDSYIISGERELWVELDGINPDLLANLIEAYQNGADIDLLPSLPQGNSEDLMKEGQNYLKDLAGKVNIKLNEEMPFITYNTKEEAPLGRAPSRTYPNYAEQENSKLTETLMSRDLAQQYGINHKISVTDSKAIGGKRPDTISSAKSPTEKLLQAILAGEYQDHKEIVILYQTNNPYIQRQTLATQAIIDKALEKYGLDKKGYKITLDGVGFRSKQEVVVINSEFAALITELWKKSTDGNLEGHKPISDLLYQTRDKTIIDTEMPDIEIIGEEMQALDSGL